ncbi:Patatin-like protein 3 [Capsicum annuum]|uniref:Patatin n=1 Tax=Capsicum annuum TaxID=4072 RepID=A0A2G3ANJ5_CAPAN|nr:Patatin-like protein 3 [Capsicum annuum]KAF3679235.1 Patatin-like protein 3 [Capsicum annuum]PHT95804.1 Patatin-like protein 3 [Capsicum annuum]
MGRWCKALIGPKYDGKYLHEIVKEKLKNTCLSNTITNVVIPTFDIISHSKKNNNNYLETWACYDAKLSDVCISTSAAPTYLPAHSFKVEDSKGNVREHNLIDGIVAANNPGLVAIAEVSKEIFKNNPEFFPIKPTDYGRFLVISIGTGAAKCEQKYNSSLAAKWGIVDWLFHKGSTPLIEVFSQSSADMVDYHNSVFFKLFIVKRVIFEFKYRPKQANSLVVFQCLPYMMYMSSSNRLFLSFSNIQMISEDWPDRGPLDPLLSGQATYLTD